MSSLVEIQFIAILISIACSLVGCFLVLKCMSMMSDAISHTLLLGIVLAFFIVKDLNSPILILGATIMGLITVWLVECLTRTKLMFEDGAMGVVFPMLFSIAIILICLFTNDIHLDVDAVMLGELAFAPFNRLILLGYDIGAKGIYIGIGLVIINLLFIALFFKELKLCTFDEVYAFVLGYKSSYIHYGLMFLVSLTCVGSFDSVGSILVIAFMVGPASSAYIITNNLKHMLCLSCLFGVISAVVGFNIAYYYDVSIAGTMAVIVGVMFMIVFVLQWIVNKCNR